LGVFSRHCRACLATSAGEGSVTASAADSEASRSDVLAAVAEKGNALAHAPEAMRSDRQIVLAAVKQDGGAFIHASEGLRADRAFVLEAVQLHGLAVLFAAEPLKADEEMALAAVRGYPTALMFVSQSLRNSPEFVLRAVQQNGLALRYANDDMKRDRGLVLAAVGQCGLALEHADCSLKLDKHIVLAALAQSGAALQHAAEPLRADHAVIAAAGASGQRYARQVDFEVRSIKGERLCVLSESQRQCTLCELRRFIEGATGIPAAAQRLSLGATAVGAADLESLGERPLEHGVDLCKAVLLLRRTDVDEREALRPMTSRAEDVAARESRQEVELEMGDLDS